MTTERNKRIMLSLRMESNHAPPAFRADVLTTVLERSVDHSFRSVLCSKGNTSNITLDYRTMDWSCAQVVEWCKSFIDDDSILSLFEGQSFYLWKKYMLFLHEWI